MIGPYARKPGPNDPNKKSRPATSAQPLKKVKARLTNYDWVDEYPNATQADTAKHLATWSEGTLSFDQGTLSRNLGKRSWREAEVTENPI